MEKTKQEIRRAKNPVSKDWKLGSSTERKKENRKRHKFMLSTKTFSRAEIAAYFKKS